MLDYVNVAERIRRIERRLSEPPKIDTRGALFSASVNGEPLERLRLTKSKREKNKSVEHAPLIHLDRRVPGIIPAHTTMITRSVDQC